MKVRIFQSAHGDCLLIESEDQARLLIDGGIKGSFRQHVLPTLAGLDTRPIIDLVCISHVDQDHIGGLLAYLQNLVQWRVFRHKDTQGRRVSAPKERELPPIGEIWHNAFHDTVTKNRGAIERMLGQAGAALTGHANADVQLLGQYYSDLSQSVGEGVEVSRRIGAEQLNIPLNDPWGGKLITRTAGDEVVQLGSLQMRVLGPTSKDLSDLRKFWNDWLEDHESQLEKLRRRMTSDERELAEAGPSPVIEAAEALALAILGDRGKVTEPNLASIMLYVEDSNGATAILTGDGHMDDVEQGLEKTDVMASGQGLHVDVLKIAHHGSEHNSEPRHYRRITADHYIFCGNGHSHNPDTRIVDAVIDSRIGPAAKRSANPEVGRRFKLWFNTDPEDSENRHVTHMKEVRDKVTSRAAGSGGQMNVSFHRGSSRTLSI